MPLRVVSTAVSLKRLQILTWRGECMHACGRACVVSKRKVSE